MKLGRVLVGAALAVACYMPCLASGLDEALAVTGDKNVAYTFYLGMDMYDIQSAMDGLDGWVKSKEWNRAEIGLWYTRTLEDGTIQELIFMRNNDGTLHDYQINFKTKTVGEAVKMFYKARTQLKDKYGAPARHVQDSNSEIIEYNLGHNDDALDLSYDRKEKVFHVRRSELDFSRVQTSTKYGKCKR